MKEIADERNARLYSPALAVGQVALDLLPQPVNQPAHRVHVWIVLEIANRGKVLAGCKCRHIPRTIRTLDKERRQDKLAASDLIVTLQEVELNW